VSESFFGTEHKQDARFVLLEDCEHIFEVTGMDELIRSRYIENNEIQMPECPKCKTPIRVNFRYSNCIKKQLNAIEMIKSKQIGDKNGNDMFKKELAIEMNNFLKLNPLSIAKKLVGQINELLKAYKYMPYNKIVCLKNVFNLFITLVKIDEDMFKIFKDEYVLEHLRFETKKLINQIYRSDRIVQIENQNLHDLVGETERLNELFKYYEVKIEASRRINDLNKSTQVADKLARIEHLLISKIHKFNDNIRSEVDGLFNDLKGLLKIELRKEEKLTIVGAIGLSKDNWKKCKNGHVYCGGAIEKSKCTECKSKLGGNDRYLFTDD
jgi:hypothetical protein